MRGVNKPTPCQDEFECPLKGLTAKPGRLPRLYFMPQALQAVLRPYGPSLHWGVSAGQAGGCLLQHCQHVLALGPGRCHAALEHLRRQYRSGRLLPRQKPVQAGETEGRTEPGNVTVATYRNTTIQNRNSGRGQPLQASQALMRGETLTSTSAASCQDGVVWRCRSRRQKPAARQAAQEERQGSDLSTCLQSCSPWQSLRRTIAGQDRRTCHMAVYTRTPRLSLLLLLELRQLGRCHLGGLLPVDHTSHHCRHRQVYTCTRWKDAALGGTTVRSVPAPRERAQRWAARCRESARGSKYHAVTIPSPAGRAGIE